MRKLAANLLINPSRNSYGGGSLHIREKLTSHAQRIPQETFPNFAQIPRKKPSEESPLILPNYFIRVSRISASKFDRTSPSNSIAFARRLPATFPRERSKNFFESRLENPWQSQNRRSRIETCIFTASEIFSNFCVKLWTRKFSALKKKFFFLIY